jgi:hypothetical protein
LHLVLSCPSAFHRPRHYLEGRIYAGMSSMNERKEFLADSEIKCTVQSDVTRTPS